MVMNYVIKYTITSPGANFTKRQTDSQCVAGSIVSFISVSRVTCFNMKSTVVFLKAKSIFIRPQTFMFLSPNTNNPVSNPFSLQHDENSHMKTVCYKYKYLMRIQWLPYTVPNAM